MIEIRTKKGYVAIVDDEDSDLAKMKWHTSSLYLRSHYLPNGKKERCSLHRVILERVLGRSLEKGEEVDHIDMNPLNNLRSNLRLATRSQNQANKTKNRRNKSGYKGVRKIRNKWYTYITVKGKPTYVGNYDTPEEAHQAYCRAALIVHGEFARG